jgi:hypothetical protein
MIPYIRTTLTNWNACIQRSLLIHPLYQQFISGLRDLPELRHYLVYGITALILTSLVLINSILRAYHPNSSFRKTIIPTPATPVVLPPSGQRETKSGQVVVIFIGIGCMFVFFWILTEYRRRLEAVRRSSRFESFNSQLANMRNRGGLTQDALVRLSLGLRRGDFDAEDYELLQTLDANNRQTIQGASREQIDRLPLHIATGIEDATCSICLGGFEKEQQVRTVACFHQFHKECVDTWLLSNPTCPICKSYAVL